jgi:5-methylcytosine-specific restriction endonuclease McrA
MKVSRICACGAIVKGSCETCQKKRRVTQDKFRGSPTDRGYDHRDIKGQVTIAEDVHHIKSIATHPELRLDWDNLMSVCRECHRAIEREENG